MPLEIDITYTAPAAGVSTIIARRNPSRRYLIVAAQMSGGSWWLWPEQQTGPVGFNPSDGADWMLLHRGVYGDLMTSDWYWYSTMSPSIAVIDAYET